MTEYIWSVVLVVNLVAIVDNVLLVQSERNKGIQGSTSTLGALVLYSVFVGIAVVQLGIW